MAKANRSKVAQAVQGEKVSLSMVETLKRRLSQALAISILAASDNASDEETHRDAASAIAEILGQTIEYLDELLLKASKVDRS